MIISNTEFMALGDSQIDIDIFHILNVEINSYCVSEASRCEVDLLLPECSTNPGSAAEL